MKRSKLLNSTNVLKMCLFIEPGSQRLIQTSEGEGVQVGDAEQDTRPATGTT